MKFYRYDTVQYARMDSEYGLSYTASNTTLTCTQLNLIKETPKGYWIGYGFNIPGNLRSEAKWVSKTSRKRYAYPTKREAIESFIARKRLQKRILKDRLEFCLESLELGLSEQKKITTNELQCTNSSRQ